MGKKGQEIVGSEREAILAQLRKAYLDELLAFYSYWVTAIVAEGWHGEELKEHFQREAMEELGHAKKLAQRILELGGDPVVAPSEWEGNANAPWTPPRGDRADADGMVKDQLEAERKAIEVYHRLAQLAFGKDPVTYKLATELLEDEVGHEEFLESLLARKGA